jgi:hypothetical protein
MHFHSPCCAYNAPNKPCTTHTYKLRLQIPEQELELQHQTNFVAVGSATAIPRPFHDHPTATANTQKTLKRAHQMPEEASETLKLAPVSITLKSWGDGKNILII